MRTLMIPLVLAFAWGPLHAAPARGKPKPAKPAPTPEQTSADRHFRSGVALFKQAKYAEALAEFERAFEIAPHPLVLYNIAGCHRQLSHYSEAVTFYRRFLSEGKGVVPDERLAQAQSELDTILALVARVSVTITPADGATLSVDGMPIEHPEMPLILPPGEHRLTARVPGRPETERTVRVASGDELPLELVIAAPVAPPPQATRRAPTEVVDARTPPASAPAPRRFAINAGFGTNLRLAKETGAPSLGVAVAIGSRFEIGLDTVLVAFAVIPSVRVRLLGDALALHIIGALPYSLNDGSSSDRFIAGGVGLGLRYRPTPGVAFQLESYSATGGTMHGTSIPTFLGGELWF